jgi:hypothetical protein
MATLTPADILRISEPVEAIYTRTVDELLINIAKHFKISGWERTRYWEIKKLAEMGALTEESVQIIAKNTGMLPGEIRTAFLQVSEKACLQIDPQLKAAAAKGILQDPGTTGATSPLIRDMVEAYTSEAVDKMNMVNTTLLQSTRQAYLQGITTAVAEAQLIEAQTILDTQALAVVTGVETRVRAIRKAMDQMSAAGLTGFVDHAGRNWSPEAYSAMVVRTASHNAAIRSVRTRQEEFGGGDIFQVSSHPGARPLCYPYQGKFYSWSAGPGEFTDGAGHRQTYENINSTSYGEPAGLFGINCGHHPIPIIPGFSYPQDGPEQSKAENDKEYKESQLQRQYERNIRIAKREEAIAEATGDKEAQKEAAQKVRREQAQMRGFIQRTGRPRRYDREQIADGSGTAPVIVRPKTTGPKTAGQARGLNRWGEQIQFSEKMQSEKWNGTKQIIRSLADDYDTKLKEVRLGAHQAAGDTQISGTIVRLSDSKVNTAVHEFAHTMSLQNQTKFGLYDEAEFWREIRGIRTRYRKDVKDDTSRWISTYEHGSKSLDEFMAEAFTHAEMHARGMNIPEKYGSDYTYSDEVRSVVKKYFGKNRR